MIQVSMSKRLRWWAGVAIIGLLVGVLSRWLVNPPRPTPVVGTPGETRPVNLEAHYDRWLTNFSPSVSWGAVPQGTQTLGGVVFDVRGYLEVTGMGAARNGDWRRPSARGIVVGRRAERIHLLHGVGWNDQDGTPVVRVVLNYRDGDNGQPFIVVQGARRSGDMAGPLWLAINDNPSSSGDNSGLLRVRVAARSK